MSQQLVMRRRNSSNPNGLRVVLLIAALPLLASCASPGSDRVLSIRRAPAIDAEVYRRAEVDRSKQLEAEVERLRTDLRRAEEALVLVESDLSGSYTRADAVSSLAEARIEVARAHHTVPWRRDEISAAEMKLDEAEIQIQQSHFGAALFYVYRAKRLAELAELEAQLVAERPETLFIGTDKANLRAGPSTRDTIVYVLSFGMPVFPEKSRNSWMLVRATSGSVGWIHQSLLRSKQ